MFCTIKYSPASIYVFSLWRREHTPRMDAFSFFLVLYFPSLFFSVAGTVVPRSHGASVESKVCLHSHGSLRWCPLRPGVELGPAQTPALRRTTTAASRSSSSAPPSIMQPVAPSCRALLLSSSLPLPPPLAYSVPVSGSVVRSLIQTLNQPQARQRSASHSHRKDIKPPPVALLCWSDRLNWVLIQFRYIFIIADSYYTRYLQSLWNITIRIYRNFVQNMPDFNAWIVRGGILVMLFQERETLTQKSVVSGSALVSASRCFQSPLKRKGKKKKTRDREREREKSPKSSQQSCKLCFISS